jgi:hypothetical protein
VRFRDARSRGAALAASPHLARLRSRSFDDNWIADDDLLPLTESPNVARLRYLDLTRNQITQRGVEAIAASPHLKSLAYCSLMFNDCEDPVDRRTYVSETDWVWVSNDSGKQLEGKYGELPWLHPDTRGAWPPSFDQI